MGQTSCQVGGPGRTGEKTSSSLGPRTSLPVTTFAPHHPPEAGRAGGSPVLHGQTLKGDRAEACLRFARPVSQRHGRAQTQEPEMFHSRDGVQMEKLSHRKRSSSLPGPGASPEGIAAKVTGPFHPTSFLKELLSQQAWQGAALGDGFPPFWP